MIEQNENNQLSYNKIDKSDTVPKKKQTVASKIFASVGWKGTLLYPLVLHGIWNRKWNHAVDCGIHLGHYSICYSRLFFKVTSIDAAIHKKAEKIKNHKNIKLIEKCLSHTPGDKVTFFIPEDTSLSTIHKSYLMNNQNKVNFDNIEQKNVITETLDNIIKKPIDFLKVDCEGSDADILMGGKNIIKKYNPTIVCNQNDHLIERFLTDLSYTKLPLHEELPYCTDDVYIPSWQIEIKNKENEELEKIY